MSAPVAIEGGCPCGAVRLRVTLPTKWCAHCHCGDCRRAHGAAFVTWFGVSSSSFALIAGDETLVRHCSSPEATRSFCGVCGATLLFESTRWPGEVHVTLACMDGPIDRAPAAHVYHDRRVPWLAAIDDGLPRLGGADGTTPLDA